MGVLDWGWGIFCGVLGDEGGCGGWGCEAFGGGGVFCGWGKGVGCDVLVGFDGRGVGYVDAKGAEGGLGSFCAGWVVGDGMDWGDLMRYKIACCTRKGMEREVNQDALLVKCGVFEGERVVLAVVCDGMGGLRKGEVASASLVREFSGWFEREFPKLAVFGGIRERLFDSWEELIQAVHQRMRRYGREKGIWMGTTLTAMLFFRQMYYVVQVGDSRAYRLGTEVCQLTKDQTLVQREVDAGRLTSEQAGRDQRRNVLLQCVGASRQMEPVYDAGMMLQGSVYLLCSDGFWHEVGGLGLGRRGIWDKSEARIRAWLLELIKEERARGEGDDISVIAICT